MTFLRTTLLTALITLASTGVFAKGSFAVSDAQSQVLDVQMPLKWRALSPSQGDHRVQGVTQVRVKLDTQPWRGQTGRIYMALAPQAGSTITAHWSARNAVLLGGQLSSAGQRGLVWSGVVPGDLLDDVLTVTIEADGRLLSSPQFLRFYFEIDVP
jgi:hypothetical protein